MPPSNEARQVFEECVHSSADSMYRVAVRLTGNRTLAVELVQETYLHAWRSLDSLSKPEKMRSWMFSIMRNQYSKLLRRESRLKTSNDHFQSIVAPSGDSSGESPANKARDLVQGALQKLPDKFKLPLLLVSMEGMTVDEAAEVLTIPKGTVLSRLHRARQKMKNILNRDSASYAPLEDRDGS